MLSDSASSPDGPRNVGDDLVPGVGQWLVGQLFLVWPLVKLSRHHDVTYIFNVMRLAPLFRQDGIAYKTL
jgi:hypothetical protein